MGGADAPHEAACHFAEELAAPVRAAAVPASARIAPVSAEISSLLEVRDLKVHFPIRTGLLRRVDRTVRAVDGVSLR